MDEGMFLEPALVLLVRVEVVEDNVKLAIGKGGNDAVHEAEELDAAAALGMRRDHLAGGNLESGEQGCRAVALVVVALAGQGPSVRQLQITLRPLQRLDRRLFVDAENNRLGRWVDIETDHIGGLRRERRIVALAPRFAGGKVDLVLPQEPPDVLYVNVGQRRRQQRTRPTGIALRRRLIQKRQNAPVRRRPVLRLLAAPRQVLEPAKTVLGK